MTISLEQLLLFSSGLLAGIILMWLIMRSRIKLIIENGQSKLLTELKLCQGEFESLQENYLKIEQNNQQLNRLNSQLSEKTQHLEASVALTRQLKIRGQEMQTEIQTLTQNTHNKNTEITQLKTHIAEIETLNQHQQKAASEKLALINETKEELK